MIRIVRTLVVATVVLGYPFLVYHWLDSGQAAIAPAVLMALFVYQTLTAKQDAKLQLSFVTLMLAAGLAVDPALTAQLTPAMIQFGLGLLFAKTVLQGPSLIERLVRLEYSEFPPGVSAYCRQLTMAWTALFAFNGLVCTALALTDNHRLWAIFNGVVVFLLMGGMVCAEYRVRRYRFPMLERPALLPSVVRMMKNGRQVVQAVWPSL